MTLTTTVAAGSNAWVFVLMYWDGADTLSGISGGSLTWNFSQVGNWAIAYGWAPSGMAGSSLSLTWTGGDIQNKYARACSFLGGDSSSFVAAGTKQTGSGTTWSNSITTTNATELVIGTALSGNGATSTPSGGSELWDEATGSGSDVVAMWREVASAGATSLAGTWSFSDAWDSFAIRLKPAAGAAAGRIFVPGRMPLGV